jgi:hypothetical protein
MRNAFMTVATVAAFVFVATEAGAGNTTQAIDAIGKALNSVASKQARAPSSSTPKNNPVQTTKTSSGKTRK